MKLQFDANKEFHYDAINAVVEVRRKCGENAEKVLLLIQENTFIKTSEIAEKSHLSQRTVENAIAKLKKAGILKRVGSFKGGYWEVLNAK